MNRLFEILLLLLEKGKLTAKELAEHFEVSQRTILRDIDKLIVANIPIITYPGYQGGISIDESFQLNTKLITQEEKEAMVTGIKAIDSISSSSILPSFINKLVDHHTISYDQIIDIDLSSWYGTRLITKIESIKQAIIQNKKLTFLYYSNNKKEEYKKVSPIKIMFRWTSWYLVGICDKANEIRFYKLNRMNKVQQIDETFKRYNHLDVQHDAYFKQANYHIVAVFNVELKYRLIDEYGIDSFIEKDNTLLFKKSFTNKNYMISWLLSFGNNVEIIEPKELRQEIKVIIKNMNKIY